MTKFTVKSNGVSILHTNMIMTDDNFVDKWIQGEYDITYREVKLIPDHPTWTKDDGEKAQAVKEEVK